VIFRFLFSGVLERLPAAIFIALFPGFFFYQSVVGFGLAPPFLGGYFGILASASFPVLMVLFFRQVLSGKIVLSHIDATFFCILLINCVAALLGYSHGVVIGNEDLLVWSFSGVVFVSVCYFLAHLIEFKSSFSFRLLLLLTVGMVLIVLLSAESGVFNLRAFSEDEESVATYQALGRSLAVSGVLIFAWTKSSIVRLGMFLLMLVALFLNGARSEFAFYVCSVGAIFLLMGLRSSNSKYLIVFVIVVAVVLLTLFWDEILAALPQTRMLEMLDSDSATSAEARSDLRNEAIRSIQESPLLGAYGSYYHLGGVGFYSHNLLSAWVNLGLVGFVSYLFLMFSLFRVLYSCFYSGLDGSRDFILALGFWVFVTLAFVAAKDYSYMVFGFAVGYGSKCLSEYRKRRLTRS